MSGTYLTNPLEFLISTIFSLYILAVMLRFLLAALHADFYNPVSQFLVRVTSPLLNPLRRIIPTIGKLDTAALVLMLALQMASLTIILLLRGSDHLSLSALFFGSVVELLSLLLNVFIFAIIAQVILSWINPGTYNPATTLLYSLTTPILEPIQRHVPPVGGLDLSPLVALIVLQLLKMIVIPPLLHFLT